MAMRCTGPFPFCCRYADTLPEQGTATPVCCPCIRTLLATPQFIDKLLVPEFCMGLFVVGRRLDTFSGEMGISFDL